MWNTPVGMGVRLLEVRRRVPRNSPNAVFLNIPYDDRFRRLYLAYIVGLVHLGLEPRVTLGIPGGDRRLDRIMDLIKGCRYSIHDLSRVELSKGEPRTPRFNMPFELGLTVALAKQYPNRHKWFVCESRAYRLQRSLSDLDGTDPNIHGGTIEGVMRELCNAFVRPARQMPTVPQMMRTYRTISKAAAAIQRNAGSVSLFESRVFSDLLFAATAIAQAK
jgi:hypothetical protein